MTYDLIKISALPAATPDESQEIVVGVGDYAKRINYNAVKADMVGTEPLYTTDTEPYLMRRTAHTGVVGKCALNKLVGGSLGWNQLIYGDFADTTHWGGTRATIAVSGGVMTGTCNSTGFVTLNSNLPTSVQNHKVAILFDFKSSLSSIYLRGSVSNSSINTNTFLGKTYTGATSWASVSAVYMPTQNGASQLRIGTDMTAGDTLSLRNAMFIDLTTMFGSTIADYIYSLELATAGAGVAWLSKYIDLGTYHAYDAGSIQSVQATAHITKDADDNVIGNYPLGSDTLRGIPQLVGNKFAFDGDVKTPDGTIRRKYGYVDMGTLNWTYNSGSGDFAANISGKALGITNIICAKYPTVDYATVASMPDKSIKGNSGNTYISVKDSAYSTAAAFKTAMSGVYLVYELATPTTESSTSYQKIQTIDADGTESFTVSSPVPVGHETLTPDNILAALGWLGE